MESYKVLIFPAAKQDLAGIVAYVNELSQEAALKLYDEIIEGIGNLCHMPMRCPLLKLPPLRAKGYRMLIVRNYLVFYIVKSSQVEIRRILYSGRKYEFLL